MSKQSVFFVGATGETGGFLLDALVEDGSFDITCFIRTVSANKPEVQAIRDRGLKVVVGDLTQGTESLAALLKGIDTVISIVLPPRVKDQLPLIDAAAVAGVRRFVPCNWGTPAPRGGVMALRDLKEEVHDHIFRHRLGYTIIDVGFWYQTLLPRLPSGRWDDQLTLPNGELFAGGTARNMLIHMRDMGPTTALIIKDDRTLNKRVFVCGDVLSQNECNAVIEDKAGEKLQQVPVPADEILADLEATKAAHAADPEDSVKMHLFVKAQYNVSMFVREDNTPEAAAYLGFIDGRALYPDYKYITWSEYIDEVMAGQSRKAYPHLKFF